MKIRTNLRLKNQGLLGSSQEGRCFLVQVLHFAASAIQSCNAVLFNNIQTEPKRKALYLPIDDFEQKIRLDLLSMTALPKPLMKIAGF